MSERSIGVREFRENMSTYIAQAKAGTPITGKAGAELHAPKGQPVRPKPRYGALKGKFTLPDDWNTRDEELLAAFETPIDPQD